MHRKHRSPVAVTIFAYAAIGADHTENTIPLLLFTGRCLVTDVV
jgi:hypothetical protein